MISFPYNQPVFLYFGFFALLLAGNRHINLHFKIEEQYLSKTNYEKYDDHILEHKKIVETIQNTKEEIQNNTVEIDLFAITSSTKDLFLKHLKLYDISARENFLDGLSQIVFKREM